MKIGIIGVGVVGGATKAVMERAHEVRGYDPYRKEFEDTDNLRWIAREADIVFVCVSTPGKEDGGVGCQHIDASLAALRHEMAEVGRLPSELVVAIRSTAMGPELDRVLNAYGFRYVCNPEFLRQARATEDMEHPARVVVGTDDRDAGRTVLSAYVQAYGNENAPQFVFTSLKAAQVTKYAANAMLAGQIALANEIEEICRRHGIRYRGIMHALRMDPRIGKNIEVPGPDGKRGYGGRCFPKDLSALIMCAEDTGYGAPLLKAVRDSNTQARRRKDDAE